MSITNLQFNDVGAFDEISFEFDEQVNVFTGPNNSGKSTVLWVLGELLVYPFTMPLKLLRSNSTASAAWKIELSSANGIEKFDGGLPTDTNHMQRIFEIAGYTCFIPAQRHATNFRSLGPTVLLDIEARVDQEIEHIINERPGIIRQAGLANLRNVYRSRIFQENSEELSKRRKLMLSDTSIITDEEIIQKIINLDYAAYRSHQPAKQAVIETIASMASDITLGFPISFAGVEEDSDGLFPQFNTPNGGLPLNVLSQGTQSIIQCLAHLLFGYAEYYDFSSGFEQESGILMIDEIDAHLHPSWQQRVIPTITAHFPNLQIFCSTHSPLMLAGLKAGQVQLLRRDEADGRVNVSTNESDISGWTADEILRNFLGVPNPTDLETAKRVVRLQELRRKDELSPADAEELEQLRHTINKELVDGPIAARLEMEDILMQASSGSPETPEPPLLGAQEGAVE